MDYNSVLCIKVMCIVSLLDYLYKLKIRYFRSDCDLKYLLCITLDDTVVGLAEFLASRGKSLIYKLCDYFMTTTKNILIN